MNRSATENTRRFCALLAAGLIGTLVGCGSSNTETAEGEPSDSAEAAPVAEGTPVATPAPEQRMAAAPDGTMMPVLNTITTDKGLVIDDLKIGEGQEATSNSTLVIRYHGTLTDGTIVDSTRGHPAAKYPLSKLIQGWRQGIPGMKVGGIRCLTVPPEMAYADKGKPEAGIPSNATLMFSIELVDVAAPAKADAGQ